MNRIVITGPESSGKTTLTRHLARHFQTEWVEEYARSYLASLKRPYRESDLERIGREQLRRQRAVPTDRPFLFCDTGLVVLYVWSMVSYQRIRPWLEQALKEDQTDLYLLSEPDMPWEPDPLREHPEQRNWLFDQYRALLESHHVPYRIVNGPSERERLEHAIAEIDLLFPS